jgi:hypothetical protein
MRPIPIPDNVAGRRVILGGEVPWSLEMAW